MNEQLDQIELVRRAQSGNKECLDQLAEQARGRLHTYVYRLTQQEELSQEIVQESLFEMCKVLGKLKKADRFWPWLHGIAMNKLRRYYRTERTQRNLAAASLSQKGSQRDRQDGLERLVGEELKEIIWSAMKKLRTQHKAVLIMRCYDGMAYADIAEAMGGSEFGTRMLFLRAKRALQRELCRNGFGKGSLLAALLVFGKMTAPSEAAAAQISVTAAATKVGVLAGVATLATTKTAIVSFTAAGALTIGTVATTSGPWHRAEEPAPTVSNPQAIAPFDWSSDAEEEYRYYFPKGPRGPMMLRARSGAVGDASSRQVLQNARANYFFSDNAVYINNHRMWADDLSVFRIPTDPPAMTEFLYEVEGGPKGPEPVTARGNGLLVIAARDRGDDNNRPLAIHHLNILDEDFFQGDWPAAARTYDQRDPMHRRGWTYFRIQGKINGQDVWGTGRVPFVAYTSQSYSPWLRLQAGSVTVVDTFQDAYVSKSSSSRLGTYRGGSFFKGLLRPWEGLHTIDTVRRDAAEQRIGFETRHTPGSPTAQVGFDCGDIRLVYTIDLKTDVIDEITFVTSQGDQGNLKFSYLQSVEGVGEEFVRPTRPWSETTSSHDSPGMLWLVRLLDASLE
ncbi:MAG: sigma-70 family RNA polymerase sigma factor [Phycisphaerales bacterium]|nr:MAG: sigma-70 family RNA polymerase sigma factor [Phycisphaerales bacterium]